MLRDASPVWSGPNFVKQANRTEEKRTKGCEGLRRLRSEDEKNLFSEAPRLTRVGSWINKVGR